jgi:hypothetical protein
MTKGIKVSAYGRQGGAGTEVDATKAPRTMRFPRIKCGVTTSYGNTTVRAPKSVQYCVASVNDIQSSNEILGHEAEFVQVVEIAVYLDIIVQDGIQHVIAAGKEEFPESIRISEHDLYVIAVRWVRQFGFSHLPVLEDPAFLYRSVLGLK